MRKHPFKYILLPLLLVGFIWEVLGVPHHLHSASTSNMHGSDTLHIDSTESESFNFRPSLNPAPDSSSVYDIQRSLMDSSENLILDSVRRSLADSSRRRSIFYDNDNRETLIDSLRHDSTYLFTSELLDSLSISDSTLLNDSTKVKDTVVTKKKREKGKPFLDAPIHSTNRDSLIFDVKNNELFIYGEGNVKYQEMELQAEYMRMSMEKKQISARGIYEVVKDQEDGRVGPPDPADSTDSATTEPVDTAAVERIYKRPIFADGDMKYDIDSIDYNLDSQKAYIQGVNTEDGEGHIYGGVVKKMADNVTHMHQGRYTTCDAECPHFYLQMTKGTVIPGKKTVFGPAYLVFEEVPLYILGLPFGFFPQSTKRKSGIIFPSFGEEVSRGFFLRDGGYYFAISDNVDLALTAGIYTLGSWHLNASSTYYKRYKFRGDFNIDFASDIAGEKGSTDYVNQRNRRITWTHAQDPKASPGTTFSANVSYTTSGYNKHNAQNMNDYLSSQSHSSVAYSRVWAGTPFSLTANGSFSHDMRQSEYDFNLPTVTFNVSRITPFKRKKAVGKERWYEKINFTYNALFQNRTGRIHEDDLFKSKMFDQMSYGVKHSLPINASFNLFQYLNITPSFTYGENWYFRKIMQDWNAEKNTMEQTDTLSGFYRVYNYNMRVRMDTKLYGMFTIGRDSKKQVRIRHVMSPNIAFTYAPGFDQYYNAVLAKNDVRYYSPYSSEMFGVPSRESSAMISFGLSNTLEMKYPSDKDTTGFKKRSLIDNLSINSSYNISADSLNLAPFNVSIRTKLFKGLDLTVSATFDPYQIDNAGRKINKFQIHKSGLARLTAFRTGFGYSFSGGGSGKNGNPQARNATENMAPVFENEIPENSFFDQQPKESQVDMARRVAGQYYDFNIPWSFRFDYNISYSKPGLSSTVTQSLNFNGNATLTEKWGASFSGGYDFEMNKISNMSVSVTRDLHCWEMEFSWIPIGYRKSWNFTIRAKSSMLTDVLKWDKRSSFYDYNYGY